MVNCYKSLQSHGNCFFGCAGATAAGVPLRTTEEGRTKLAAADIVGGGGFIRLGMPAEGMLPMSTGTDGVDNDDWF
jgi:hypothetical protein